MKDQKVVFFFYFFVIAGIILFSSVGHVSGRQELVSLEDLVSESSVIVLADPIGESKVEETKDGFYKYALQTFNIKKVLHPTGLTAKSIIVSSFDDYMYDIIKFSKEGKGNKIGIFKRYHSIANLDLSQSEGKSTARILFLKDRSQISGGDYEYSLPGSYESINAEKKVIALLVKLKK